MDIWNSTKYSVTTGIFVARIPCGAKPQIIGAQGPASRPHFGSIQAETSRLYSQVGSQEDPVPESQWKKRGVADRPRGWPPDYSSPLPLYRILIVELTHTTLLL
jgi:hypothetical protein